MPRPSATAMAARLVPPVIRPLVRGAYRKIYESLVPPAHWAHPSLKKFGTVQDLYYWVSDGDLDTVLYLQNYFSVFFPDLDTSTHGRISLYGKDGVQLVDRHFSVGHLACPEFKVSSLLEELGAIPEDGYGTLEVDIAIPQTVLRRIRKEKGFYFFDRFYLCYVNSKGQPSFVHGVDRTNIYPQGRGRPAKWYETPVDGEWAPEIPVDMDNYKRFRVVLLNRSSQKTTTTMTLSDCNDNSLSWSAEIQPNGVARFDLTPENTSDLAPKEMRMRVQGMASQWGRPVVFKEFHNGAFSAMHC